MSIRMAGSPRRHISQQVEPAPETATSAQAIKSEIFEESMWSSMCEVCETRLSNCAICGLPPPATTRASNSIFSRPSARITSEVMFFGSLPPIVTSTLRPIGATSRFHFSQLLNSRRNSAYRGPSSNCVYGSCFAYIPSQACEF